MMKLFLSRGNFSEAAKNNFLCIDIHELLPQQDPFVMVGRLVHYDELDTITETLISEDNIFVADGELSAPGIMENIAQTCAARIGYINKYILLKDIQVGYIGDIRKFEIFRQPCVGETIRTSIHILGQMGGLSLAKATVNIGEEIITVSEVKIAVKDEQ